MNTDNLSGVVGAALDGWRSGTERSQWRVLAALLISVSTCVVISVVSYSVMPVSTYYVWLVLGMLLLRFRQLLVLTVFTVTAGTSTAILEGVLHHNFGSARTSGIIALFIGAAIIVYHSGRQRTGLPVPVGENMLVELRERLQIRGQIPALPEAWHVESSVLSAGGAWYAGDFLVAAIDRRRRQLDVILVDVMGKGVAAATDALQFQGALSGLIGSLPPVALMEAANDFLLRFGGEETLATAALLCVDLDGGEYRILSAGHPPALQWNADAAAWRVDNARGMALGVQPRPDLFASEGRLRPGEALMFYTDGVIETRTNDIDSGIEWLQRTGARAVGPGFEGASERIISQVSRGDDDRAVLILQRKGDRALSQC